MSSYHVLSTPSILQGLSIKYPYKEENNYFHLLDSEMKAGYFNLPNW